MPRDVLSLLAESMLNYGPSNIFCAALVFTDSFAIHLRDKFFQLAWMLKIFHYVAVHIPAGERRCAGIASGVGRRNATRRHFALWIGSCLEAEVFVA